jgi:hypothetical protein
MDETVNTLILVSPVLLASVAHRIERRLLGQFQFVH